MNVLSLLLFIYFLNFAMGKAQAVDKDHLLSAYHDSGQGAVCSMGVGGRGLWP
jgi:hypothetical protein